MLNLYLKHLSTRPPLDREDEIVLANIMLEKSPYSAEAKNVMIEANIRLVISIAKEHQNLGVELEDLISEGNVGLIKAIERFDPLQGNKLSTYACWWIRQYIHQSINNTNKTIRIPTHASSKIRKLKRITLDLALKLNRSPTPEEISKETDLKIPQIEKILLWDVKSVSLSQTLPDGNEYSLEAYTRDLKDTPSEALLKKDEDEWADTLLTCLTHKEKMVISYRFGLNSFNKSTLEEIGDILHISRERVRQIETIAIKKLQKKARFDRA